MDAEQYTTNTVKSELKSNDNEKRLMQMQPAAGGSDKERRSLTKTVFWVLIGGIDASK